MESRLILVEPLDELKRRLVELSLRRRIPLLLYWNHRFDGLGPEPAKYIFRKVRLVAQEMREAERLERLLYKADDEFGVVCVLSAAA